MQTHKPVLTALFILYNVAAFAQNTGIGTATPSKKLSVAGSIAVDHDNANAGVLDSAALVFGTDPFPVGISSNKVNAAGPIYRGMDLWTGGQRRLSITDAGLVGVGTTSPAVKFHVAGNLRAGDLHAMDDLTVEGEGNVAERVNINGPAINGNYRLTVNNGNSYVGGSGTFESSVFSGAHVFADGYISADEHVSAHGLRSYSYLKVDGYTAIGGNVDSNYRLRVWDGSSRFGGDFHATGNAAIGGEVDPALRFRVWGGNSRFGGDVEVTGNLNVGQINGTGTVRSNGPSPLRIGFDTEVIGALNLAVNQVVDRTVNITAFDGGADDVRVSISQFVPDPLPAYANWQFLTMHIHSVDPVANTAKLRLTNTSSASQSIKGTLYLLTVAKN